ncbi:MAG: hypothetical protein K2X48_06585 [Chitinophagaceae bacterium]|nr:hypothetical protein [Chitinophagaceae bacterium]
MKQSKRSSKKVNMLPEDIKDIRDAKKRLKEPRFPANEVYKRIEKKNEIKNSSS